MIGFGTCPECDTPLEQHPETTAYTKGKNCPNCDFGYLEGI